MEKVHLSLAHIAGREQELVAEAFESNYVAPAGPMLERFETAMCDYTGISHAVALSSGTAALHLALIAADIKPGQDVWTSSMTFMGGVGPIAQMGARPIFFDLDEKSWTIDCDLLEEALQKSARENTLPRAIIPTDLYGQAADISRIVALGKKYGVQIISDSAEAVGAFRDGKHAGRDATSTVFSFNGNKIITSSGGGMLMSDDPDLIAYARKLSTQSREECIHYEHKEIGYNYRLSNISAAIGLGQLEGIEEKVAARRKIFELYREAFQEIGAIDFMPEPEECRSTHWLSCITIDPAQTNVTPLDVYKICDASQIEVRPLWKPMHMQPVFAGSIFKGSGVCERLFSQGLCLPSGSGMSDQQQQRVIEVVLGAFRNS